MQLKHKEQFVKPESFLCSATSMQWAPDSKKLAVLRYDRQMVFYNENCQKWDQVQTRGVDHTKPSKDYVPTCQSHSNDSCYIAVGQSDMVVYVFNVGKTLEKKAIQGRFALQSPATSICWMSNGETPVQCDILVGCQDGSAYILNMAKKQTLNLFSYQCFAQLLQQKQVAPDGQPSASGTPIIDIHRLSSTQAVFVNESGISALFDLEVQNSLKMVSRHQSVITTSALMFPRNQPQKQFLILADTQQKVVVNAVETGQALASVHIRAQGIFTAAAGNPSGNGVLLAGPSGLQYINLASVSPFVVQHDPDSSLELSAVVNEPSISVTALAWRPDSSVINVAFSDGSVDEIVPSLSAFTYCGVEITNTAPNKSQLKLKNFNSTKNNFPPGILELTLQNSIEVKKIRAYPKSLFQECCKSGNWKVQSLYICAYGERSVCIYSFETDLISEINIQLTLNDKLYFDIGVKRCVVQANMQLGEFTTIYLPFQNTAQPIVFSTIRQCSYAASALISCSPQLEKKNVMLVAHLGEDRQEFMITELSPPDDADDFTEPVAVIARVKHTRIIDWIDMSPTGKFVLVRDVSGAIMVYAIDSKEMIDLSPTLGNGMVQWASPFDVVVAQESADCPVLVYYNPGDSEDKPQLLTVPNDSQGWTLTHIDSSQVQVQSNRTSAAMFAVVAKHDGSKTLQLALDQDLLLFNMLLASKEVNGAVILLTKSNCSNKNQWLRLCQIAQEMQQFMVCSRCYAALGDLGLSKYARDIHQRLKSKDQQFESDFVKQTYCNAQIALLKGDLDTYDRLLGQCGKTQEAINIYRDLHLHHRAEQIAPESEKEQLHNESIDWLISTKQSTLAAQLKAQKGDFRGALELLMNDKAYLSAYELTTKIMQAQPEALGQHVVESLATSLEQSKHYLQAGNLAQSLIINDSLRALGLFRRGGHYAEAIALARQKQPSECIYIEKEWADSLQATGHFEQSIPHYIEARETRKAVDASLKAGNHDTAERLLLETNVENSLELCLRLAEAKYLQGEVDSAVDWFKRADQQLLAVAALTSVGRFEDAVRCVQKCFPATNAADVIIQEATRLIKIEEKKNYITNVIGGVSAANIIQKMESMSSVHGVLAARDLLAAAGLHEKATEVLISYKMWDELVNFAREFKVDNFADVLARVAEYKREKNDMRGCAQLLSELAFEIFKVVGKQASNASYLKKILGEATKIYNELNLFEDSIQIARRCNDSDIMVTCALQWIQQQPNQFQNVAQQLIKYQKLEQTTVKAIELRMFDVAMQLAEQAQQPEITKKDVWYRQGMLFEQDGKLQEAEHAYSMAGRPIEALHMYIDNKRWVEAENVINNMPMGQQKENSIKLIKEGRAKALVDEGKYREAEQLYIEMNNIEEMVKHYKTRQMWQEALRLGKQFDRRDLIIDVSEAFAEKDKQTSLPAQKLQQQTTLSQQIAQNQIAQQRRAKEEVVSTAVGFKNQIIQAVKLGGEQYLSFILQHSNEIATKCINGTITEEQISEDIALIQQIANLTDDMSTAERAMLLVVTYMTKGVPQSLINEKDSSKSTISPLMIPGANPQHLQAVCKAVLGLEYGEEEYKKRILQAEITRDGIYSKCKQMMLNYRQALMSSQKGQQSYQSNKLLSIPGDQELSRCFDAIHLLTQSAQTLNLQNSPQQLKEKCQIMSSLVRYCDLIPVDRCFAMAGLICKQFYQLLANETAPAAMALKKTYGGQAYVFLNRLMDVLELQPGQTTGELDAVDIRNTGIPWDVKTQKKRYLLDKTVEEVRGFVMSAAVQNTDTDQELPRENCPHGCSAERWTGAVACTKCKNVSPVCCVTGQHVINHHLKTVPSIPACNVCGCYARPAPWNAYVQKTKSCPVCGELGNPMGK